MSRSFRLMKMRFFSCSFWALLTCNVHNALARSSWTFTDASVAIQGKGSGQPSKQEISARTPLPSTLTFGSSDTLKIALTTTEDSKAKRPHQAFLTLQEPESGLEDSFAISIKGSGKGKLEITHKDLPVQLLASTKPLTAWIVLGSFGSSNPLKTDVFSLDVQRSDTSAPLSNSAPPERYSALPEIHHIFGSDPKSPPVIFTAFFASLAFIALPILLGVWLNLGLNVRGAEDALKTAPVAHGVFLGSLVMMEIVFLCYYISWSLFTTLPAVAFVGSLAFVSGSRALSEVQERRLAGTR